MKFQQGMWLDGNANQNPKNTTRKNKNLLLSKQYGSISNENGFLKSIKFNKKVIYAHPLKEGEFVVFLQPDEIGIVKNKEYKSSLILPFGFNNIRNVKHYVNNLGEVIVSWCSLDDEPRMVNLTSGVYNNLDSTSLTNYTHSLNLETNVENEGSLKSGSYYPICRYKKNDGSYSNWFRNFNPVYITNDNIDYTYQNYDGIESGEIGNKSIILKFSGLNLSYNFIEIGVIYQKNGVLLPYYVKTIPITNTSLVNKVNGQEIFKEITLNDVLVDSLVLKNIKHLTVDNNSLIGADFSFFKEGSHQKKVNDLVLNFYSEESKFLGLPSLNQSNFRLNSFKYHERNNIKKGFCHGEVYCFYICFEYKWGYGRWFILNGRKSKLSDLTIVDGYKKYQIDDTCSIISSYKDGFKGEFSYWENENEPYPNNGEYDTGNVRHFKFPTLNWCRNNLYNNSSYGASYLDVLGIVIENLNLNDFYDCDGNKALSYRIGYAKRNGNNNRVIDSSIVIVNQEPQIVPHVLGSASKGSNLISTGTNHDVSFVYSGNTIKGLDILNSMPFNSTVYSSASKINFRTYPFNSLRNKNKINSNYFSYEFILNSYSVFSRTGDSASIVNYNGTQSHPIVGYTDYTEGNTDSIISKLIPINSYDYISNNTITNVYNNLYLEEFLSVELIEKDGIDLLNNIYSPRSINDGYGLSQTINEKNALITFLNVQKNYYFGFQNQQVVNCGQLIDNLIFGGDNYICDYSVNLYGNVKTTYSGDFINDSDRTNTKINGVRVAKRFLCESSSNINLRFISSKLEFKNNTSYYPKISLDGLINNVNTGLLQVLERDKNPNDFINGYSNDYNNQNILQLGEIYDYTKKEVNHRYSIIKSEKLSNFDTSFWRLFKENNIYQFINKNNGFITNLESNNENLYIHFERSLFMTRGRQELTTDLNVIKVDVGNIFDSEPVEVLHEELGQLGTQHKTSCLISKFGYIFFDGQKGIWWLVDKNKLDILSNKGLHNYFRDEKICHDDLEYGNKMGFSISYDEFYNRLILSRKFKDLPEEMKIKFRGTWIKDQEYVSLLKSGDIVFKDGKYKIIQ